MKVEHREQRQQWWKRCREKCVEWRTRAGRGFKTGNKDRERKESLRWKRTGREEREQGGEQG